VTDTKNGQEAVFLAKGVTVEQYEKIKQLSAVANATFDAWLFTMSKKIGSNGTL
jgi:hypothetical protein